MPLREVHLMRIVLVFLASVGLTAAEWPAPQSPVVPEADGYVAIPEVALPPAKGNTYRAIFDATRASDRPAQLLPALNMVGSELNALAAASVPVERARFVIVFHGAAVDGILDNDRYKAKFGLNNPNLPVIAAMKKCGVEFFVCGQYLAGERIDPKTLTRDVKIAADALLVLMEYQNKGYALLSF